MRTYTKAGDMTEAALQAGIVRAAKQLGWKCYHTFYSIHSTAGYPDLTLVRGRRLVFAELKSAHGKLTAAQAEWLNALKDAGAEAYLVRPDTYDDFLAILTNG